MLQRKREKSLLSYDAKKIYGDGVQFFLVTSFGAALIYLICKKGAGSRRTTRHDVTRAILLFRSKNQLENPFADTTTVVCVCCSLVCCECVVSDRRVTNDQNVCYFSIFTASADFIPPVVRLRKFPAIPLNHCGCHWKTVEQSRQKPSTFRPESRFEPHR